MAPEAPPAPLSRGPLGVSRIVVPPMDLTWLGHACFRMRGREGIVLTDPPDPKSGHAIPRTEASLVTISHDHPGHASLSSVAGEPVVLRGPGEYEVHEVLVTGLGTFHDDEKGAARGPEHGLRDPSRRPGHLPPRRPRARPRRRRSRAARRRRHRARADHPAPTSTSPPRRRPRSSTSSSRRSSCRCPTTPSSEKGQPLLAPLT